MKNLLLIITLLLFQQTFSNVIILNGLTHTHKTKSGDVVTGIIKLKNTKESEQRVIIYFNDLFQNCGEETVLTNKTTHNKSIEKWVSTEINEYVLQGKEEYELIYTLKIPSDSSLLGSYWGVLMIEVEEPIKEDSLDYSVKLQSKIRYGIQLIADVNDKTSSELEFFDIKIDKDENNVPVSIAVEAQNLGAFYVEPTIVLEVFNEEGEQKGKQEVKFKKIYPKSCKVFTLDISTLPKGNYTGVIVADYGEDMYAIDIEFEK
ncbi:hypothetical protein SAMN05444411_101598 [Lutibacter oricola]|uniref:DUF3324 domain-containing protein n=1 Tax=Lutibacter oricola TaxID=762486 RepID=A0A1H2T116_9FLAO|nr:hypothetical protein [Lutibacter oricola]SDW37656.1 hypothetical protein SAMN05444411_101598 [Lutibacter oricola]